MYLEAVSVFLVAVLKRHSPWAFLKEEAGWRHMTHVEKDSIFSLGVFAYDEGVKTINLRRVLSHWEPSHVGYGLAALGSLGFGLRVALALFSFGSNDIRTWNIFALLIDQVGVSCSLYEHVRQFNHPPLMGYLASGTLRISQAFGIPFALAFKLPMICADVLATFLLWKIWKRRCGLPFAGLAVAAFGGSMVSILVSSFHGNTDSLSAFLCLLCAYFIESRLPFAGGLALAGAINVKLLPIVLIPAFVLSYRSWSELMKFIAGSAVGLLPFLPFLIGCRESFYQNAIRYTSNVDQWGIMLFLLQGGRNPAFRGISLRIADFYIPNGRFIIMGLIVLLSLWARVKSRWNCYELGAMCFSIFLIFTPGFGVQYLVYVCPLLFAVSLGWAILYSTLAGIFLASVYYAFWTGTLPFYSEFISAFPMPTPLFGLLAWMLLVQFVLCCLFRGVGGQDRWAENQTGEGRSTPIISSGEIPAGLDDR